MRKRQSSQMRRARHGNIITIGKIKDVEEDQEKKKHGQSNAIAYKHKHANTNIS